MSTDLTIKVASTSEELSAALEIRHRVFVREQGIPAHLDTDGLDDSAIHAICLVDGTIVATGRLSILESRTAKLARIAVLHDYRGRGLGRLVVRELESIASQHRVRTITIHPHDYLEEFYGSLGYIRVRGTSVVGRHDLITMRKSLE